MEVGLQPDSAPAYLCALDKPLGVPEPSPFPSPVPGPISWACALIQNMLVAQLV